MNFKDLLEKMKDLDEGHEGSNDPDFLDKQMGDGTEQDVEECMPISVGHAPKQSDSVTMNVSMNGSGKGGIRDLMDILKNIEDRGEPQHDRDHDIIIGEPGEIEIPVADEAFANEPNTTVAGIDAVTGTGDDLASKGKEAPKVNGGGNPMHESLVQKLAQQYEEIKSR